MRPPGTQFGRILLLGVIASLIAAPLWVWLLDAPTTPTAWHGYTIARSDVKSFSNGEPVQYFMDMWLGASAGPSELRRQAERCDPAQIVSPMIGRDYRGVMLCNTARLGEDEFSAVSRLFDAEVDGMHARYYSEWASLIAQRLALLLAAALELGVAAWAVRWVRRGQPT